MTNDETKKGNDPVRDVLISDGEQKHATSDAGAFVIRHSSFVISSYCPPVWQIWRNPIVRRYATARLRPLRLAAWSLVVQALGAFLWLVVYFSVDKVGNHQQAALTAWIPILILQGVIWLLKGTFSVAVGIAREGAEGLSETQRLTPLSAWHKVIGYLIGLPILETALVASLLPWSAVSIIMAKVPLAVVFRVHLLLVTAAILHHAIGLVAGTVIKQKIVAGTVSQTVVIILHVIVPLFSRLGLVPLGHLGVESAITSELFPLQGGPAVPSKVRFFDLDLSLTGYGWVISFILIVFLLQILWRRWKRADAHLFGKPVALVFSAWLIVMTLGETFPLVRDGSLFDLGNRLMTKGSHAGRDAAARQALSLVSQGLIPIGWAGAFGCVALLSAMLLAAIITPTLERHGSARRTYAGTAAASPRLPWGSDAQGALLWTAVLGLMALAGWSILVKELFDSSLLHLVMRPKPALPLILGAGLLVPLLTWALLLEWRGPKIACLGAFVLWIIPMMVGTIGILSGANGLHWPKWWLGLSGFVLPFYSMSQSMSGLAASAGILQEFRLPWLFSLTGHAVLAVVFYIGLRKAQLASTRD